MPVGETRYQHAPCFTLFNSLQSLQPEMSTLSVFQSHSLRYCFTQPKLSVATEFIYGETFRITLA